MPFVDTSVDSTQTTKSLLPYFLKLFLKEFIQRTCSKNLFKDIDRRRMEASEDQRKPRLIEENEVPTSIIEQHKRFTEEEEKGPNTSRSFMDAGVESGRRKRREVNYAQVRILHISLVTLQASRI